MGNDIDDSIQLLLTVLLEKKTGLDRDSCVIYLRSTGQKQLFAAQRLETLKRSIDEYIQKYERKGVLDRLPIEMDLDHCISSLRSCLEHLAQLINAVIPLGLSPRFSRGETPVTLLNVADEILENEITKSNPLFRDFSFYLRRQIESDWYRELHDLRITMFHDRSDPLSKTTLRSIDNGRLLELRFLLPSGMAKSRKTEKERDITAYCTDMLSEVESVLVESLSVLCEYLSS